MFHSLKSNLKEGALLALASHRPRRQRGEGRRDSYWRIAAQPGEPSAGLRERTSNGVTSAPSTR